MDNPKGIGAIIAQVENLRQQLFEVTVELRKLQGEIKRPPPVKKPFVNPGVYDTNTLKIWALGQRSKHGERFTRRATEVLRGMGHARMSELTKEEINSFVIVMGKIMERNNE